MRTLIGVLFFILMINSRSIAADLDTTSIVKAIKTKNTYQIFVLQDQTRTSLKAKSPSKAALLALGHTLIPLGIGIGSMVIRDSGPGGIPLILTAYGGLVGPSMGNFYAEDYFKGGVGIALRVAGTLMVASSIGQAMSWGNDDEAEGPAPGQTKGNIGVLLVLGSALWNIFTAPGSAENYNQKNGLSDVSMGYDPVTKKVLVGMRVSF